MCYYEISSRMFFTENSTLTEEYIMNIAVLKDPLVDMHKQETASETRVLSEQIIPAVPGEYYAYTSEFTEKRPEYALMKCKSNKARPMTDLPELGSEANLLFLFDASEDVKVCSVGEASDLGIIEGSIKSGLCYDTSIAETQMSTDEFYNVRAKKDVQVLADICKTANQKISLFISLKPSIVVSVLTTGGKYGLFLIKDMDKMSIKIDACHVLV